MPIMVIAKKSCRVMIEPPEKGAGDRQSVDMETYQQQISLSGKYQSVQKLFFRTNHHCRGARNGPLSNSM